jgi:hypothetical protein
VWSSKRSVSIQDIPVNLISIPDLIVNKKATGRTKDLADVELISTLENDLPELS